MKLLFFIISIFLSPQLFSQESPLAKKYEFVSIEYLIEQEVGRIVLTQIYKNIGIDISITPLPAQRSQIFANTGIKDGEIMRIWTYGDENENTIRVPTPYYYLETMPFVLKKSNINIRNKDDLKKYRLAKVRGVKHTNNITEGMSNVFETNSTENMLRLLESGQVDVVLTNTIDGNLAIAKQGYDNIIPMQNPLATLPLYHYIYKDKKVLVPMIDQEIKRLKMNGELQGLIKAAEQNMIHINK